MSALHLTPSQLSRFVYILDNILCNKIGNPVVLSIVTVISGLFLTAWQAMASSELEVSYGSEMQDYFLHLIHNLVNLLFIIRFPSHDKRGLLRKSDNFIESCFFVIQMMGIFCLYFTLSLDVPSANYSLALRSFMVLQIICPFIILAMSIAEKYYFREETEKQENDTVKLESSILAETNNNLLPIFMANSFAYIGLKYYLADAPFVLLLNYFACFLLKFTLIHRFILHGVVVVINGENVKDYSELYLPVSIGNKKLTWLDYLRRHETIILQTCSIIAIFQDLGTIALESLF